MTKTTSEGIQVVSCHPIQETDRGPSTVKESIASDHFVVYGRFKCSNRGGKQERYRFMSF